MKHAITGVIVGALAIGCLSGCQSDSPRKSASAPADPRWAESILLNPTQPHVIFSTRLHPDGYYVGYYAGNDIPKVAATLFDAGITNIVLESTHNLTPEFAAEMLRGFETNNVVVEEFWVLSSLMKSGAKNLQEQK